MKTLLTICISLLFFSNNPAGEGVVVTPNGSLNGHVQVNIEDNEVVLKDGLNYVHLHARDVRKITQKDDSGNRVYVSMPFGLNSDWFLFEALTDGELPLLYREGIKLSEYDETEFPPFFMKIGSSVYSIESKKQVLEVMNDKSDDIKAYIRENKLQFGSTNDLISLFRFYNSL